MRRSTPRKIHGYTIIVGCGRLGAHLAGALSDGDGDVIVIDSNPGAFRRLSPSYGGIVMTGDATEISVLNDAEISKATALITVTNSDNTNILVAQLAKEMFNIERVIARLYDPECECVYQEFGIDTICPAVLSAREIDRLLHVIETEELWQ